MRDEIANSFYQDIIDDAPVFLKSDKDRFADFISKYVTKITSRFAVYS